MKIEKEIDYPGITEELKSMALADQEMRTKAEKNDDEWDDSLDVENTQKLKEIVKEIGWPRISVVGQEASHSAWLLVQHADKDVAFQEECLALMEALPEGEVSKHDIAYLIDRIRRNKNLPQVYGTQFIQDASGQYISAPIEGLDERRKEMGLDTLEENTKRINER